MKITYDIQFSLNLANVFPVVGELVDNVNTHLASMEVSERLTLRGNPIKMTLTVERELNQKEIATMKDIITARLCDSFAGSNPVCESFRRQSGNVEQLVEQ